MFKLTDRKPWLLLCFFAIALLGAFFSLVLLQDKVIGAIEHPGLQGEILFQKNIIYSFEKGNLFRYFLTDYLNYPFGENLGFGLANSLHLFMYIPLKYLFSLTQAYNILVGVVFLLNLAAAYLLARHLFSLRRVAFCAALVFALNPYVLLKINQGFINKTVIFWIALHLLELFKLQTTKKRVYIFWAGILLCLMQLTYPPYSLYTLIFTMGLGVYYLFKPKELFFAVTRFIGLVLVFVVCSTLIYFLMGLGFVYGHNFKPIFQVTGDGNLDLFSPFLFFPYRSGDYPTYLPLGISLTCFFLGLVACVKNIKLSRLLAFNLILFIIIAAGPYLTHNGQYVCFLGKKVILPFYLMAKYMPLAGGIYFPIRVFPFINICLAVLAGYGLVYLYSSFKRLKPLLAAGVFLTIYLLENFILFPQIFPLKTSKVCLPKFYAAIKNENFEAVLDLPVSSNRKIINRYGYYAALSGKKIMNPYNLGGLFISPPKNTDSQESKKEFILFLSQWDVRYIIIHKNLFPLEGTDGKESDFSWLALFCQEMIYPQDNLLVYKIPITGRGNKKANTIRIPADFPLIQKGIEAAKDGDIVLVAAGRYKENIDFQGKGIVLKSISGPKITVIDGRKQGPAVSFRSQETITAALQGFTVCNGSGSVLSDDDYKMTNGGGILCLNSSPLILGNVIENNSAKNGGGVCCLKGACPLIVNNIIRNNYAAKGGGIRCSLFSSPKIFFNKLYNNHAIFLGGGIYWRMGSCPDIRNNIVKNNSAGEQGGGLFGSSMLEGADSRGYINIAFSTIRGNKAPLGSTIGFGSSNLKVKISYCDLMQGKGAIQDPFGTILWETTGSEENKD